ncbi:prepilin-type N-terminal cleavage/methylation domain-containing protein [Haloferula sp. BvORR071]|uniref:prepilin-type N-terminal cleavage/methylation domain-containing protein n=1 Tax=Haloferula sp. BvORR071 TaxID=1396141 RepID=UPI00054FFC18|nr:prepilin-type N-terminal cleavage/methylation domain-containing protein [Haloferula sp. BvORR071]
MKKPAIVKPASGFTLVELMVVIVIMIVLVALGSAMFISVRNKSQLTASVANLRDLGVKIEGYSQDNAGVLPVYKDNTQNLYWWGMLVPGNDINNESLLMVFKSPAHKEFDPKKIEQTISYGWNAHVCGRSEDSTGGEGPKRKVSFKNPGSNLVLTESPRVNGMGLLDDSNLPDPKRYKGKAAALMLDGSAKQLDIETEFKRGNSKWLLTEEERDAKGIN